MEKKVIQIVNSYAPAFKFGGANKIMFEYAQLLSENNYSVDVFTTDVKDDYKRLSLIEKGYYKNISVSYFYNISTYLSSKFNLTISPTLWLNIILKTKKYDYIHFCEHRGILPFLVLLSMKFNNAKLIHSGFGMLSSIPTNKYKRVVVSVYDFICNKFLINRIDIALCESKNEVKSYRKHGYKGKCIVIPNIVQENTTISIAKNNVFDDCYINLLFLARIHPSKGVLDAVILLEKLNKIQPKYKLTIIGNDEGDLNNLNKYISSKNLYNFVEYIPAIYGNDRFTYYKYADAFILLPKANLETSLASIEALSLDCFIIFNNNSFVADAEKNNAGINIDNLQNLEILDEILSSKEYKGMPIQFYNNYFSNKKIKKMLIKNIFN
mgnify:CR=1 FL=1|jgi:glycosyltransferase involved in cell wall biosynthesis